MALVKLNDKRKLEIPKAKALEIWAVLTGTNENPTEEQIAFCDTIDKIYLNWRDPDTPDSYIRANEATIIELSRNGWMCNSQGYPTRPEFSDKRSWYLVKALGWKTS